MDIKIVKTQPMKTLKDQTDALIATIIKIAPRSRHLIKGSYIGDLQPHNCEANSLTKANKYRVVTGFLIHPEKGEMVMTPHVFNINDQNKVVECTNLNGLDFRDCLYFGEIVQPKKGILKIIFGW
jgi:hypothetical protein